MRRLVTTQCPITAPELESECVGWVWQSEDGHIPFVTGVSTCVCGQSHVRRYWRDSAVRVARRNTQERGLSFECLVGLVRP